MDTGARENIKPVCKPCWFIGCQNAALWFFERTHSMALDSISRRDFLTGLGTAITAGTFGSGPTNAEPSRPAPRKVAAAVTVYTHNSHADVIVGRLLEGYNLDGEAPRPNLKLVSLYIDQIGESDKGRRLASEHRVPVCKSIEDALTFGSADLAVDGVLLIGE